MLYFAIGLDNKDPLLLSFGKILRPEHVLNDLFSLDCEFIGHDLKDFFCFCLLNNATLPKKIFDTAQAHFVVDPSKKHDWESVSSRLCSYSKNSGLHKRWKSF
jgi:hypothetical protein